MQSNIGGSKHRTLDFFFLDPDTVCFIVSQRLPSAFDNLELQVYKLNFHPPSKSRRRARTSPTGSTYISSTSGSDTEDNSRRDPDEVDLRLKSCRARYQRVARLALLASLDPLPAISPRIQSLLPGPSVAGLAVQDPRLRRPRLDSLWTITSLARMERRSRRPRSLLLTHPTSTPIRTEELHSLCLTTRQALRWLPSSLVLFSASQASGGSSEKWKLASAGGRRLCHGRNGVRPSRVLFRYPSRVASTHHPSAAVWLLRPSCPRRFRPELSRGPHQFPRAPQFGYETSTREE